MLRSLLCTIVLCVFVTSLSACSIKKVDTFSSMTSNEQMENSSDTNSDEISSQSQINSGLTSNEKTKEVQTQVTRISSSEFSHIESGCTYKEIMNILGASKEDFETNIKVYLVDEENLFVLRFENINDICEKSGKAMLEEAKSIYPPLEHNEQIKKPSTVYGIIIDEKFICCIGNLDSEFYALLTINAEVKFANGEKANSDDLRIMDGVIVTYDRILSSMPPQLYCKEITIIR